MPGDRLEVTVVVQQRGAVADRRDRDEEIQLAAERFAGRAACPVDPGGLLEVRQALESEDRSTNESRPYLSEGRL